MLAACDLWENPLKALLCSEKILSSPRVEKALLIRNILSGRKINSFCTLMLIDYTNMLTNINRVTKLQEDFLKNYFMENPLILC